MPRHQGCQSVREGRSAQGLARGVLAPPRALHRAGAQGSQCQRHRIAQGQAFQRRQPGLGHARLDGRADGRAGLEDERLLAGLRAPGRRTWHHAVRQQDRRIHLWRGASERKPPGPDHHQRRQAGAADRPGPANGGGGPDLPDLCLRRPRHARPDRAQGRIAEPRYVAPVAHHRRCLRHRAGCVERLHLLACRPGPATRSAAEWPLPWPPSLSARFR